MRRLLLAVLIVACLNGIGCKAPSGPPPSEFRPTATVKDIMDSIVDPSADAVWNAVAETVTASGVDQRRPTTNEQWTVVRRHAIQLLEAANLLVIEGRRVAAPGERSANPGIELSPDEIAVLINRDRLAWTGLARKLGDAVVPALSAIESRDPDSLTAAGEKIDQACEQCHLKYWYPNGAAPSSIATSQ